MKKIIVGILSLAFLFPASLVTAGSVTWNTKSNDCPTGAIAVHETQEGFGRPCWFGTNVSANPGQSVNVRFYYHNTGTETATNTKVVLNTPTINTKTSTHIFSGYITSNQGNSQSFSVKVNLTSPQKLSFHSTSWYTENTKETPTSLLYGQTGVEVINGGLNIGSITPEWDTQGSVVVAFRVENPQPKGTITAATNSCQIQPNQNTCPINFTWNTQDPIDTSVVKNSNGETIGYGNSNSQTFNIPFNGSTYTLFNNNMNLSSATVSTTCAPGSAWNNSVCAPIDNCTITSLTASSISSSPGEAVTLSWATNSCTSVKFDDDNTNRSPNSTRVVYPSVTTTYYLEGTGETSVKPRKEVRIVVGGPAGAPTMPAGASTMPN